MARDRKGPGAAHEQRGGRHARAVARDAAQETGASKSRTESEQERDGVNAVDQREARGRAQRETGGDDEPPRGFLRVAQDGEQAEQHQQGCPTLGERRPHQREEQRTPQARDGRQQGQPDAVARREAGQRGPGQLVEQAQIQSGQRAKQDADPNRSEVIDRPAERQVSHRVQVLSELRGIHVYTDAPVQEAVAAVVVEVAEVGVGVFAEENGIHGQRCHAQKRDGQKIDSALQREGAPGCGDIVRQHARD